MSALLSRLPAQVDESVLFQFLQLLVGREAGRGVDLAGIAGHGAGDLVQADANGLPEHNDLMSSTRCQARLMGVTPVNMVPLNPLVSTLMLLQAKLHGLTARVPPLLG
jgi:hypothetical protein